MADETQTSPLDEDVILEDINSSFDDGLSFVDFFPERTQKYIFRRDLYEKFNVLVDRANRWLEDHIDCEVKSCETVERRTTVESMSYFDWRWCLFGLRVWYVTRTEPTHSPQQIGCINLVAQKPGTGSSKYETMNDLVKRFNERQHLSPIPGRIVTIETKKMDMRKLLNFNPELTYYTYRYCCTVRKHIYLVKVFYVHGFPEVEEIGLADFVPMTILNEESFALPEFESYSNVIKRASEWCAKQDSIRLCYVQPVDIKMKGGQVVDTQRLVYNENDTLPTDYVRILRLAFVKSSRVNDNAAFGPIRELNCKTFVPLQVSQEIFLPTFETIDQTRKRIQAWTKVTGANVISCNTMAIRLMTSVEAQQGAEASSTYNSNVWRENWIFIIRLFLDGFYEEPSPDMLPKVPVIY